MACLATAATCSVVCSGSLTGVGLFLCIMCLASYFDVICDGCNLINCVERIEVTETVRAKRKAGGTCPDDHVSWDTSG